MAFIDKIMGKKSKVDEITTSNTFPTNASQGTMAYSGTWQYANDYRYEANIINEVVKYNGGLYASISIPYAGQYPDKNPKVWELIGTTSGGGFIPIGSYIIGSQGSNMSGYLSCDGSLLLVTEYQNLCNAINPLLMQCSIGVGDIAIMTTSVPHGLSNDEPVYFDGVAQSFSIQTFKTVYVTVLSSTTFKCRGTLQTDTYISNKGNVSNNGLYKSNTALSVDSKGVGYFALPDLTSETTALNAKWFIKD